MVKTKICSKCKKRKKAKYFDRRPSRPCGLTSKCKKCQLDSNRSNVKLKKYRKEYYQKNKQLISRKASLKYIKEKKQRKVLAHKYYLKNKSKILAHQKKYQRKNKAKIKEQSKRYRKTEKGRAVELNNEHRRNSQCKITNITATWLKNLKISSKFCPLCNRKMVNKGNRSNKKHLDHIKPLCCGGQHVKKNVRFVCMKCNLTRPKNGSDIEI